MSGKVDGDSRCESLVWVCDRRCGRRLWGCRPESRHFVAKGGRFGRKTASFERSGGRFGLRVASGEISPHRDKRLLFQRVSIRSAASHWGAMFKNVQNICFCRPGRSRAVTLRVASRAKRSGERRGGEGLFSVGYGRRSVVIGESGQGANCKGSVPFGPPLWPTVGSTLRLFRLLR